MGTIDATKDFMPTVNLFSTITRFLHKYLNLNFEQPLP